MQTKFLKNYCNILLPSFTKFFHMSRLMMRVLIKILIEILMQLNQYFTFWITCWTTWIEFNIKFKQIFHIFKKIQFNLTNTFCFVRIYKFSHIICHIAFLICFNFLFTDFWNFVVGKQIYCMVIFFIYASDWTQQSKINRFFFTTHGTSKFLI